MNDQSGTAVDAVPLSPQMATDQSAMQATSVKFWPEQSEESSWEKRITMLSYACCCSSRMRRTTEDGQSTPLARMAIVFASVRVSAHTLKLEPGSDSLRSKVDLKDHASSPCAPNPKFQTLIPRLIVHCRKKASASTLQRSCINTLPCHVKHHTPQTMKDTHWFHATLQADCVQ